MRERNKIILEYGTYMLSFCQLHSVTGKMVLCFGNYSDCGSCLFVCSLGKGKWKLCGTEALFTLAWVGGQGISCLKLSTLQDTWSYITWLSFFVIYIALE